LSQKLNTLVKNRWHKITCAIYSGWPDLGDFSPFGRFFSPSSPYYKVIICFTKLNSIWFGSHFGRFLQSIGPFCSPLGDFPPPSIWSPWFHCQCRVLSLEGWEWTDRKYSRYDLLRQPHTGWPDWAIFSPLGDCLPITVFWKSKQPTFGATLSTVKVMH
jgi:hypothetical protein